MLSVANWHLGLAALIPCKRSRSHSCSSENPHLVLCRQGRSDLLMTALKSNVLRDHLCWLWRVGDESSHPVLSQAALLSEQVLRILGVEHSSLDHLLCQVSARSARVLECHAFLLLHIPGVE